MAPKAIPDFDERHARFEKAKCALVNYACGNNMTHELRQRIFWKIYHIRLMQVWMWNGSYRRKSGSATGAVPSLAHGIPASTK